MLSLRNTLVINILLVMPVCYLVAQVNCNGIDPIYGFDPVLYNGRHYTYQSPPNTSGNPYLFESGFEQGCISVKGKTYCNLELNYDLLNQLLLLKYLNHEGEAVILEIPDTWLERLRIGPMIFEPVRRLDGRQVICQVIQSGQVKVHYYRRKDLKLDNVQGTPIYVFSKPVREQSVLICAQEHPYRNTRDFLQAFNPSVQVIISNYLKNNRIKLLKASDAVMADLVNFCDLQIRQ